ncbi:carbon-nitrogen hydrolase family protein [Brevibacterium sp. 50QC2O2]|uniref:carbon-nitrogen hydrolase family protein n=1 Tax=Brevibacterium sp. 50QC2O2 TaxID=2968459 RepID=UPI00211BB9AD|nr:carbon-nitrogen hydrolase family protein [Brevibacterium sp. 50QC2O2]MCQ9389925.1 carbon-nitrogen hydrolase family protein [Brevibacterium sp. 50QC2O2]
MSTLQISVAQFAATTDVRDNIRTSIELVLKAGRNADLVILPEYSLYADPKHTRDGAFYSEPVDGPFVRALGAAAKKVGVHVLAGMTETNPDAGDGADGLAHPFNTLVHVTPAGELAGTYRKIHLYDAFGYKESDELTAGAIEDPFVFDIDGVKVGAATCYDLRFPEIFRRLTDAGAHVIALPASWVVGPAKEYHWATLIAARAIENTVYMAASGQTAKYGCGQSMILDPMGTVLAGAGEQGGAWAQATIDTERIAQVRTTNAALDNRRFAVVPK